MVFIGHPFQRPDFFCRPSTMINIILKRRRITKSIGRQNILATTFLVASLLPNFKREYKNGDQNEPTRRPKFWSPNTFRFRAT